MKKSVKNAILVAIVYGYLAIPFLLFAGGWLKWYLGVAVGILTAVSLWRCVRESELDLQWIFEKHNAMTLFVVLALIAFWVWLSGISGLSFQNHDHWLRNNMYEILVEEQWPVRRYIDGHDRVLVYYMGYWLLPALIGKFFGYQVGWYSIFVLSVFSIFLVYVLLCAWRKRVEVWPMVVLILFSGLDLISTNLLKGSATTFFGVDHIDGWLYDVQLSAMSTQLYWVFNQAIPAWVCVMLLMAEGKKRNLLFPMGCMLISSVLPFVGLVPIAAYLLLKDSGSDLNKGLKNWFKKHVLPLFSFQNLVGVFVVGLITVIYISCNMVAGNNLSSASENLATQVAKAASQPALADAINGEISEDIVLLVSDSRAILRYIIFAVTEFGLYAALIWKRQKKNPLYYIVILSLALIPFIRVAEGIDFSARASIPALFVLMLYVIDAVDKDFKAKKWLAFGSLVLVLAIGSSTAIHEIRRSMVYSIAMDDFRFKYMEPTIDTNMILWGANFSGYGNDKFFFEKMVRPTEVTQVFT